MTSDPAASADDALQPLFRSASVARRVGMPVATLRICEQRHRAVRPATAPSGHRLYSPADVTRLLLLRRLTAEGHAIGSIAGLATGQLRRLAVSTAAAAAASTPGRPTGPLRLVVIGRALATRLQRPTLARRLAAPALVVAVFDTPEAAAAGAADALGDGLDPPDGVTPLDGIDLLLWQVPGLPARVPPTLVAAGAAWGRGARRWSIASPARRRSGPSRTRARSCCASRSTTRRWVPGSRHTGCRPTRGPRTCATRPRRSTSACRRQTRCRRAASTTPR